ncbi:three component ABC system middle component [Pseudomonas sp. W03]|uniref:three component ABC system middle component n=1 Tax=Pseudomonas sp. W03 TaxID=3090666 RepID=UPI003A4D5E76
MILKTGSAGKGFWEGYNNVGIGVVAVGSVLNHLGSLSIPKTLLIIPMIMHSPTLAYMGSKATLERGSAALASGYPQLLVNFNERFESSLPLSVNSIQLLIHLGYAELGATLVRKRRLPIDSDFGKRAKKIDQASQKIAELLLETEDELYLNFRVKL